MDAFAALVLSALVIASVAGGHLLARDVTSWSVDMDGTEVAPGLSVLLPGTYPDPSSLSSTPDRGTCRIVALPSFTAGWAWRGSSPASGT